MVEKCLCEMVSSRPQSGFGLLGSEEHERVDVEHVPWKNQVSTTARPSGFADAQDGSPG